MTLRAIPLLLMAGILSVFCSPQARSTDQAQPAAGQASGPAPGVRVVTFSPDGKLLAASAGEPKEAGWAAVWDLASRKPLFVRREQTGVPSVAFSPDGTTLAVAAFEQPVRLLDARTGAVRAEFKGHEKTPRSVAFSPDGKVLATGSYDQNIKLWELGSGKEMKTLTGHTNWVRSVEFTPDGRSLLSVAWNSDAKVWDLAAGKEKYTIKKGNLVTSGAVLTPDGRTMITGSNDGMIRLWDVASGEHLVGFEGGGGTSALAYSATAGLLAKASSFNRVVRVFAMNLQEPTAQEKERIRTLLSKWDDDSYEIREAASKELRALGFGAESDLRRLMKDSPSAEVRIRARRLHEAMFSEPKVALTGHLDEVQAVAFSPDGKQLASGGKDATLRLWDLTTGKELAVMTPETTSSPR